MRNCYWKGSVKKYKHYLNDYNNNKRNYNSNLINRKKDSNGNTVNIFLLLPQYFVITVGEVMNSVTGLEFSYTQAPKSMKSVVQSFWLLTTFFGNIFDIFFVEIKIAPTQVSVFIILMNLSTRLSAWSLRGHKTLKSIL